MKLSQIHFPDSRIEKLALVVVSFLIALVLLGILIGLHSGSQTFDWTVLSLFVVPLLIVGFPTGLLFFLGYHSSTGSGGFDVLFFGICIWLLYSGITLSIVLIKNPYISRILYFVLILLLIANVRGCATSSWLNY